MNDRRVIGVIVYVLRNRLKAGRSEASKTLYNRFIRWSRLGVFGKILQKLSKCETEILMMDATHLKVHRTAASLKKWNLRRGASGDQRKAWQQIAHPMRRFQAVDEAAAERWER